MSLRKKKPAVRDKPAQQRSAAWLCTAEAYDTLCCGNYIRLANNPEVCAAVDTIAKLVASMTIHLMENTSDGDVRIRNSLSRKIDIEPNSYMTRANYVYWIVKTMMLGGDGNAVVLPTTKGGYIDELHPVPPYMVSFRPEGWSYRIGIGGREHEPSDVLHFVLNPDENQPWRGTGYGVQLSDVVQNLKQASATTKAFMESKWKPSVIVKVDAMTDEFASPEGRKKLLREYIETDEVGQPWLIPTEQFSVQEVRPHPDRDRAGRLYRHGEAGQANSGGYPWCAAFCFGRGGFQAGGLEQFYCFQADVLRQHHPAGVDPENPLQARMVFPFQSPQPLQLRDEGPGRSGLGYAGRRRD